MENGDWIELDVEGRRLHLDIGDEELERRRKNWKKAGPSLADRGYVSLYIQHVQQADKGADLDFLVGGSGPEVSRDSH